MRKRRETARSSSRIRLHVGPLSPFHSPNWLLLRKRQVFHVAVSLPFDRPRFLRLAASFSQAPLAPHCSPGTTAHSGRYIHISKATLFMLPPPPPLFFVMLFVNFFHVVLVLNSDRFHFVLVPVLESSRIS